MAEKNEKEKVVNEQIRDFGQVELEHGEDRISMLTIIGEIEGMSAFRRRQRRQSMSMCFQNSQRWKKIKMWMDYCFC